MDQTHRTPHGLASRRVGEIDLDREAGLFKRIAGLAPLALPRRLRSNLVKSIEQMRVELHAA